MSPQNLSQGKYAAGTSRHMMLVKFLLAIFAGACLWASFAPLNLWPLAIIGIALFVYILRDLGLWGAACVGLCVSVSFFMPLFFWARIASSSVLAWCALFLFQALYIVLVAIVLHFLLGSRFERHLWLFAPAVGIVWVACEQLRAIVPLGGMPWGLLAFGQVNSPLVHLAPYGSTQLVGWAVVCAGAALAHPAIVRRSIAMRAVVACVACCAVLAAAFIPITPPPTSEQSVRVAYAQGIVARADEEVSGSRALQVTKNLAREVRNLQESDFDFLVLPESTSDRDMRVDDAARSVIAEIEQSIHGRPILLGTQEYIDDYRFNDYVLVHKGEVQARYSKQHPVPFGEYLPWRSFLVPLIPAASQIAIDMRAGDKPAVLDVPLESRGEGGGSTPDSSVRVAVPICFEVADSAVLSQAIVEGAELIVVPTNNASFGDTAESRQQFDMTRFRAIEYGRDAVQISTVGVSGAIRADGSVVEMTEPWTAASSIVTLSLYENTTWSARFYPQIVWAVFCAGGLIVLWALVEYVSRRVSRFRARRKGQE